MSNIQKAKAAVFRVYTSTISLSFREMKAQHNTSIFTNRNAILLDQCYYRASSNHNLAS